MTSCARSSEVKERYTIHDCRTCKGTLREKDNKYKMIIYILAIKFAKKNSYSRRNTTEVVATLEKQK
jgi:hypothetical protein